MSITDHIAITGAGFKGNYFPRHRTQWDWFSHDTHFSYTKFFVIYTHDTELTKILVA